MRGRRLWHPLGSTILLRSLQKLYAGKERFALRGMRTLKTVHLAVNHYYLKSPEVEDRKCNILGKTN